VKPYQALHHRHLAAFRPRTCSRGMDRRCFRWSQGTSPSTRWRALASTLACRATSQPANQGASTTASSRY